MAGEAGKHDPAGQPWTRRVVSENPALVLSGMYLVASLIGLAYSWNYFRFFGVNLFRYADISDFLLASLKEPLTWLLAIFGVLLVLLDNAGSRRVEARGPGRLGRWYGNKRYRRVNYAVAIAVVAVALHSFAQLNEQKVRNGETPLVTVQLTDGSAAQERVLLGTTSRFAFFYDGATEQVFIHPHENILAIAKTSPDR